MEEKASENNTSLRKTKTAAEKIQVPSAITDLRTKQYIPGLILIILGIGFAVSFHEPEVLFLSCFGLWFLYSGQSVYRDYIKGKITEATVVCSGVRSSRYADNTTVAFDEAYTDQGDCRHYQFRIAGRKRSDRFITGGYYIIYFRETAPSVLITYSAVHS